ncbi:hypothetical protein BD310DRAFT_930036 [Dichomitus squalens]|uniref:Uncharacterized protein n=1 Tax=Dichomitus squalens TaxID=114155 RepID=A0A4Q9PRT5_9APHY|nr:hypothetical protein BD310DRAFT_930036 [Dichomitus squalens]
MSRPLTLHVSALNDAEYTLYTSSIHDIIEYDGQHPPDYDKLSVGVREARAWLRGRYPTLASNTLDSIFRLLPPEPADVLNGGQFFAVLRLVSHVLGGKQVDPSLIFVQAHPDEHKSRPSSPHSKHSRVSSPVQNPFRHNGSTGPQSAPAVSSTPAKPQPPSLPPKPTNPFLNRRASQGLPPQSAPAGVGVIPSTRSIVLQDANIPPLPPRKPPVLPPPRHASMNAHHTQATSREPPLPPTTSVSHANRHTTNTLIQQSLQATRIAQSLKQAEHRLEQERVMEVLRSSSDSVNSLRRVRSTSPTKNASSSASSAGSASSSAERTAVQNRVPQLPPRRNLSPPASTVISARSFERVATASLSPSKRNPMHSSANGPNTVPPEPPQRRLASPTMSPSQTPPRPLSELPPEPPPTHPDRKPAALSIDADRILPSNTSPRVGRSRSLHHPTPPPVPPPPRRKRPESAQLTPTSSSPFESPFADTPRSSTSSPSNLHLSRHLSLSSTKRDTDRERNWDTFSDSPIGSLQKTFTNLSLRGKPALDAARYKAEGAFSKRGFVQRGPRGPGWMREDGEARLMDDVDDGEATSPGLDVDDADSSLDQDGAGDRERVEDRARRWQRGGVDVALVDREDGARGGRRMVVERDDLKWPAGEGWKPL